MFTLHLLTCHLHALFQLTQAKAVSEAKHVDKVQSTIRQVSFSCPATLSWYSHSSTPAPGALQLSRCDLPGLSLFCTPSQGHQCPCNQMRQLHWGTTKSLPIFMKFPKAHPCQHHTSKAPQNVWNPVSIMDGMYFSFKSHLLCINSHKYQMV